MTATAATSLTHSPAWCCACAAFRLMSRCTRSAIRGKAKILAAQLWLHVGSYCWYPWATAIAYRRSLCWSTTYYKSVTYFLSSSSQLQRSNHILRQISIFFHWARLWNASVLGSNFGLYSLAIVDNYLSETYIKWNKLLRIRFTFISSEVYLCLYTRTHRQTRVSVDSSIYTY